MSERRSAKETIVTSGSEREEGVVDQRPAGQNRDSAAQPETLRNLFAQFLELEEVVKRASEEKAHLFDQVKTLGFDSKAVRVAFRRRKRELDEPGSMERDACQDELVAEYLLDLRRDSTETVDRRAPRNSPDRSQAARPPTKVRPASSAPSKKAVDPRDEQQSQGLQQAAGQVEEGASNSEAINSPHRSLDGPDTRKDTVEPGDNVRSASQQGRDARMAFWQEGLNGGLK